MKSLKTIIVGILAAALTITLAMPASAARVYNRDTNT